MSTDEKTLLDKKIEELSKKESEACDRYCDWEEEEGFLAAYKKKMAFLNAQYTLRNIRDAKKETTTFSYLKTQINKDYKDQLGDLEKALSGLPESFSPVAAIEVLEKDVVSIKKDLEITGDRRRKEYDDAKKELKDAMAKRQRI